MRQFRLRVATMPFLGYCFRWAVLDGRTCVDLALTRRAALRRRPKAPATYATVVRLESA